MPRWTFTDGTSTVTFTVNPSAGGSPKLSKRFYKATPTNPAVGFAIRMEGRPNPPTGNIAGAVRDQAQYETLVSWVLHKPVITVTDDLGRTYTIVPGGLTMTPGTRVAAPWRATYTLDYTLVDPAVI